MQNITTIQGQLAVSAAGLTQEQQEAAWLRFGSALAGAILRDEQGNPVHRRVSDFMLMHTSGPERSIAFKARESRNYVYLRPSGQLFIPRSTQAFHRGFF